MNKKTIEDIAVDGKKVFVRVDFNVPMDENLNITNDTRIRATLPTIKYLLDHNAAVILACHLGRPKGERVAKFSVKPVAVRLAELLGHEVKFAEDCIGEPAEKAAAALKSGEVLLLENLRYHNEEEKNDPEFSKKLASLADVAVNDAFGVSHRAHASVEGITKYIETVAGYLMEKEIKFIGQTLANPQRPFVAIIGGAKVSDKIGVISNMIDKVDTIIIMSGDSDYVELVRHLKGAGVRVEIAAVKNTTAQILIDEADLFTPITEEDCYLLKTYRGKSRATKSK